MVKIRLSRTGRKHLPQYRIVVTPAREKRESDALEYVGHYHPLTKDYKINKERVEYWLSVGAQPTDTVRNLLVKEGILEAPKHKKVFKREPGEKMKERKEKKAEKTEVAKTKKTEKKEEKPEEKEEEAPKQKEKVDEEVKEEKADDKNESKTEEKKEEEKK